MLKTWSIKQQGFITNVGIEIVAKVFFKLKTQIKEYHFIQPVLYHCLNSGNVSFLLNCSITTKKLRHGNI